MKPGDKFGKVTIIKYSSKYKRWECKCECGEIIFKTASHLGPQSQCAKCYRKKISKWKMEI